MSLVDIIYRQFNAAWQMLSDGSMKCPEESWKSPADDPFFTPARLAIHAIQTVDYYTSDNRDGFDWRGLGFDVLTVAPDQLPQRPVARDYCHRIQEQVEDWLIRHGSDGLLAEDTEFTPDFATRLDRAIYVIRHTQHHAGQLSREIQIRGFGEMEWV